MANQVLGRKIEVELLIGVLYYPVFCGKTADLNSDQDEVEVTHVNSGADREYVPGMGNSILNIAGVTVIDNSENRVSSLYLAQVSKRRSIDTYRVKFTSENAIVATITFSAFIKNINISKDVTAWSQSTLSLRITGAWTFSSTVPPPPTPSCEQEPTIYSTLADGSTTYSNALLIPGVGETITILHVSREGTTYYETSGSPGNLEFKYTSGTGTITFQYPGNPAAPLLENLSIEYKIEV